MSIPPSLVKGASFQQNSLFPPSFLAVSNTFVRARSVIPPSLVAAVDKVSPPPTTGLTQRRAVANGGRNSSAPQLEFYVNARNADGTITYADPFAAFNAAVVRFLAEDSLRYNPKNGSQYLNLEAKDKILVQNKSDPFPAPSTTAATFAPTSNSFVRPDIDADSDPANESYDNLSYTDFNGGHELPCISPAYPGASTATCGETFTSSFSDQSLKSGLVQRYLANPYVSSTLSSSNWQLML